MKKKLLFFLLLVIVTSISNATTFPIRDTIVKKELVLPSIIKVKTLEKTLQRKLTGKEKLAIYLYNHKLIPKKLLLKLKGEEEDNAKAVLKGKKSLRFSIVGWGVLLIAALSGIPFLGLAALACFVISIVNGIQSLNHKKKDNANAVLGIIFSGLYFLSFLLGIVVALAFFL